MQLRKTQLGVTTVLSPFRVLGWLFFVVLLLEHKRSIEQVGRLLLRRYRSSIGSTLSSAVVISTRTSLSFPRLNPIFECFTWRTDCPLLKGSFFQRKCLAATLFTPRSKSALLLCLRIKELPTGFSLMQSSVYDDTYQRGSFLPPHPVETSHSESNSCSWVFHSRLKTTYHRLEISFI